MNGRTMAGESRVISERDVVYKRAGLGVALATDGKGRHSLLNPNARGTARAGGGVPERE